MSRTIPRAYVTAAWNKNPVVAKEDAKQYCQELVKAGYLPLCPILAFDGIFSAEDTEAHKRFKEMSEDLLRRARFLVICGNKQNEEEKLTIVEIKEKETKEQVQNGNQPIDEIDRNNASNIKHEEIKENPEGKGKCCIVF